MADDPDSLVLAQLRGMRAALDEMRAHMTARLDSMEARLDAAEKRHEEVRGWVVHCLGLCSIGHMKNEEQDARLSEQERRMRNIAEIQEALRSRLY